MSFRILFNHLGSSRQSLHGYTCLAPQIAKINQTGTLFNSSNELSLGRQLFLRSFSAQVSSSDQLNLIKLLRERTSAPIKEVKSALVNCNWDIENAQTELRKRGIVLASKKSSRTATEGLLALAQNESKAALIELNCETDFVSRNEIFQYLALSLAKLALSVESSRAGFTAFSLGSRLLGGIEDKSRSSKTKGKQRFKAITEVAAMVGENVKLEGLYSVNIFTWCCFFIPP
ncbi:hypothetical protein IFM89_027306 [Coptis chinensis]|uniref:Elongation factor Ts, mitochondrial n=1 Tax=Coptis chinensis TaxID=261450 RepID=A0A835I4L9_9MAGN|nr:hypothetical protein IFM89_027306 [Coptis chinensis]